MIIGYIRKDGFAFDQKGRQIIIDKGKDGKPIFHRVLSDDGKVIFEKGEELLYGEDTNLFVSNKWSDWFLTNYWEGNLGSGPILITNKRLIHYRDPDPNKTLESMGETSTLLALGKMADAGKAARAKKRGNKDFCEFSFSDIIKIEIFNKCQSVRPKKDFMIIGGTFYDNVDDDDDIEGHRAYIDILYNDQPFRVWQMSRIAAPIQHVLKDREVKTETIGRGSKKRTVTWYANPDDITVKKHKKRDS